MKNHYDYDNHGQGQDFVQRCTAWEGTILKLPIASAAYGAPWPNGRQGRYTVKCLSMHVGIPGEYGREKYGIAEHQLGRDDLRLPIHFFGIRIPAARPIYSSSI